MPAVPLAVSSRPSAPWPGVSPAVPSTCSSRTPASPGALPNPGAAPLRSCGRGRAAAARVGTLCATAVVGARRPMPSWPTAVCPCGPSGSASPHGRLRGGARGSGPLAVPPSWALSHSALAPYPGSPPPPLLTARPPPSRGGAGPAMLLPALLRWACGGSSGLLCVCGLSCCPFRLWLFSGAVPRGCSTLLLVPLPPHWLAPRAGSILVCSARVLCASVSLRWTCVSGCGHVCVCQSSCFAAHRPSLFRRMYERWKTFPFLMGPHVCWPASVSARRMVVCVPRFLFVGFLFDELVPCHCRIPCLSGAAYCRPVGFLAGTPQVLRWAFV
jgi:hypothetical protein